MTRTADRPIAAVPSRGHGSGCPACGASGLRPFYSVPGVPAHSCLQMPTRETALAHPRGDLDLAFCPACGLVTNRAFRPELLDYSAAYEETQGASATFGAFARSLAGEWIERYELHGRQIVEIGCGKGEFLTMICAMGGNRGIGFDPAWTPGRADPDADADLQFVTEFYSRAHRDVEGDFFCCRHTLEHIAPVAEFIAMLRANLRDRPEAVVAFEVPALERILDGCAFWDLYYEHCSYFARGTLERLFRACGFRVLRSSRVYGDQYLVIEARPDAEPIDPGSPEDLRELAESVERFERRAAASVAEWKGRLAAWRGDGKRVVLWGSGSKAVGFLATLGAGDLVEAVVDINPHKHGRFMPGCWPGIIAPERLRDLQPDAVIIMNGIYREEIAADLGRLGLAPELAVLE